MGLSISIKRRIATITNLVRASRLRKDNTKTKNSSYYFDSSPSYTG